VLALANRIRDRLALPFGPDDDRYVSGNVALYNQRNAGRVFDAGVKAYQDALVKSGQQIDAQLLIVNKNIGATGRLRFNAELQSLVNPAKNGEPEYISSYVDPVTNQKHHLRLNDRVMILKNDKHVPLVDPKTWERRAVLGENGLQQTDDFGTKRWRETIVANGDTGVVAHIDTKRHFVVVQIGQQYCYYSFGSVPRDLTLAYAITVHKAQGGQADTVIAIVNGADMMLNAQSFYTALTRTQQQFIFFGDFRVLLARTKIYPIDARHDLLGSFLSGQLTVDTFSRYTFDQVLAWLDKRHAERLSTRPALEAEEVKPSEQPFAVRYAEQLDILDQIIDEVAQLPARKPARDV
jgi:exodeoxyribonuclease V alpha subunit